MQDIKQDRRSLTWQLLNESFDMLITLLALVYGILEILIHLLQVMQKLIGSGKWMIGLLGLENG